MRILLLVVLLLGTLWMRAGAQQDPPNPLFEVSELDERFVSDHVTDTMSNNNFIACYESRERTGEQGARDERILCRIFDEDDEPEDDPFQVSEGIAFDPCVAVINDDRFVVGYERMEGDRIDIVAKIFNSDGEEDEGEHVVFAGDTEFSPGDCAIARRGDNGFLMVWHVNTIGADDATIRGRFFDNDLEEDGDEFEISETAGRNRNPSVAAISSADDDEGRLFVVAWNQGDETNLESVDVLARQINSDGESVGDEWQVNVDGESGSYPVVKSLDPWHDEDSDGDSNLFAIMWHVPIDEDDNPDTEEGTAVFLRIYTRTAGDTIPSAGDPIHVNEGFPAVRVLPPTFLAYMTGLVRDGAVVCWVSPNDACEFNLDEGTGVMCRLLSDTNRGEEGATPNFVRLQPFRPIIAVAEGEGRPRVAPLREDPDDDDEIGGFVLSWESLDLPDDGEEPEVPIAPPPDDNVTEPTPPPPEGDGEGDEDGEDFDFGDASRQVLARRFDDARDVDEEPEEPEEPEDPEIGRAHV